MAPPSKPKKKLPVLELVVVIVGFLGIMFYNRMTIARLERTIPNVNSKIVGEWKAERGSEHLTFRDDKSVTLSIPATAAPEGSAAQETSAPPPVTGKYQLGRGGRILVELMNGKKYTTTLSPQSPDRLDLIDASTDGVTTYDRVP